MGEAIRRLRNNIDWEVNKDWIIREIVKISDLKKDDKNRELVITKINDNYNREGSLFFSLNGSPPRGFAIYNRESKQICFISWGFKKKRVYKDTILKLDK